MPAALAAPPAGAAGGSFRRERSPGDAFPFGHEVANLLAVEAGELEKLDRVDSALPCLALGDERLMPSHGLRHVLLRQAGVTPGRAQSPKEQLVPRVVKGSHGLAGAEPARR